MKKKTTTISEEIKYASVYRDDIEEAYIILQNISDNIYLEIDNYLLDSTKEIDQVQQSTVKKIDIRIENPSISVSIDNNSIDIRARNPDPSTEGITYKLIQIFSRNKNHILSLIKQNDLKIGLPLMFIGEIVAFSFAKTLIYLSILGLVLAVIGIVVIPLMSFSTKSVTINLCYKKERPNFFRRNKDEIVINVIFMIVSLILGALIGKYLWKN